MASYADIPESLRHPAMAPAFVTWLIEQPVTFHVRRALAHLWEQHNDTTLLNGEWIQISKAPEPTNGPR